MGRQGLNATLTYKQGSADLVYRVRCSGLTHGVQMVAEESQARMRRAYYPHRVTTQQFGVQVDLVGWNERRSLTNWLAAYASYALDPDLAASDYPTMAISVPDREFFRRGIPITGYEWGDHVGSMVFSPILMFEAAYAPWDKGKPVITTVENTWSAFAKDAAIQYFYPFSTQLAGDQAPLRYDKLVYPGDPGQFNDNYTAPPDTTPVPDPITTTYVPPQP